MIKIWRRLYLRPNNRKTPNEIISVSSDYWIRKQSNVSKFLNISRTLTGNCGFLQSTLKNHKNASNSNYMLNPIRIEDIVFVLSLAKQWPKELFRQLTMKAQWIWKSFHCLLWTHQDFILHTLVTANKGNSEANLE